MTAIRDELKQFIIKNYLGPAKSCSLSYDDSFLEKGILDSIGVLELANFIQAKYKFKVRVPEIIPDNFDTVNNLERYILKKTKA